MEKEGTELIRMNTLITGNNNNKNGLPLHGNFTIQDDDDEGDDDSSKCITNPHNSFQANFTHDSPQRHGKGVLFLWAYNPVHKEKMNKFPSHVFSEFQTLQMSLNKQTTFKRTCHSK